MNKNTTRTNTPKLNSYFVKDLQETTIIFNRLEKPIFNDQPLIVTETEKHYYYLSCSSDDVSDEKIVTDQIYCMEKSVMEKFVDVEKARWLRNLNSNQQPIIVQQLIGNLSFINPLKIPGSVWLAGAGVNSKFLPKCSILEVNYDEARECFLPDLVFCHPKIWESNKSDWEKTKLDYNLKNEVARITDKFLFHLENIMHHSLNSVLIRIEEDLTKIIFYLQYLHLEYLEKNGLGQVEKGNNIPLQLKPFYFKDFQEKTLIFSRLEQPIFNHQPLIITETEKHYYYLSISNNEESDEKIVTDHLFCMEKSVMEKFIDVEKVKSLKDLNSNQRLIIIEQLIKNLSFIKPDKSISHFWTLSAILDKNTMPHCSILEVNYDEKEKCFLPDLVFCHPEIWHPWTKSELNKTSLKQNMKDEIERIVEKFLDHSEISVLDPINSVWNRLRTDLELIVFYLKDLKKGIKQTDKKLNN